MTGQTDDLNDGLEPVGRPGNHILDAWRERGRHVEILGRRIFVVEEGSSDHPWLVILHGFPTSSADYHRVIDRFAARYRVVVHDHPGFGFSDKPADYSYSLFEQADTALRLWLELGVRDPHLLAHDYGTSVATEILARRDAGFWPAKLGDLRSVTWTNGSLLLELARLRMSQRIARSKWLGPFFGRIVPGGYFKNVVRRLWADPSRCDADDLDAMWRGIRYLDGHLRTHQISQYLRERVRFRTRWISPLARLDVPCHVLWARQDPVAVAAIGEKLTEILSRSGQADPETTWLEDAGHFPMLEQPEAFADAVLGFLRRIDGEA